MAQSPPLVSEPNTTTAADSVVTFNEIMYHPAGDNDALEWIELYNQMSLNMDISNWRIEGAVDFRFPTNTVLGANKYIIIAADPARFRNLTDPTNVFGPYVSRLSNSGETLRLRNNSDRLMDEITYADEDPWPVGADGSGASLAKLDKFNASSPARNWRPSAQPGGTPTAENFPTNSTAPPPPVQFISTASSSRFLVPTVAVQGWPGAGFSDSQWTAGTAALGYDSESTGLPGVAGPTRAYTFDGTLNDATGSGFNGENFGAQFSTTIGPLIPKGQSLRFEGTTNHVRIGDPVNSSAYTISLWVAVDEVRSSSVIVRTDPRGTLTSWSHQLRINGSGKFEHYLFDGGGRAVAATNDIIPGVWNHVALTATSGGNMEIYVNGVPSGEPRAVGTLWAGGDQWRFGTDAGNAPNFFKGRLDEIGIWHTVLDRAAIERLATGISPAQLGGFRASFTTDVQSALYQKNSSLFVRIPFENPAPITYESLTLRLRYADGFVAYLNGVEVARRNAPQTVSWDSRASLDRPISEAVNPETFDLSAHGGNLIVGTNVLAIQALTSSITDPSFLLTAELSGQPSSGGDNIKGVSFSEIAGAGSASFFLELFNSGTEGINLSTCSLFSSAGGSSKLGSRSIGPGGRLVLRTNDFGFTIKDGDRIFLTGPNGGVIDAAEIRNRARARSDAGEWLYPSAETPGEPNTFALRDDIVINEIMYHHPPTYRKADVPYTEHDEEWIELYNKSNATVDLQGWQLVGEVTFIFPAGTILPADSYLIVARNAAALRAKYPGITIVGDFPEKLSNRSGHIRLLDAVENPADELRYHNNHPWPVYPNGGGSTLELRDPRSDNSVPESWGASIEGTKTSWKRYSYRATAVRPTYTPAIGSFHEFRMGLLDNGEALVDNVTVYELPTNSPPRQLLQNTNFTGGSRFWRILGTHRYSVVKPDPDAPENSILHLIATGPKSYMDNRLETTLKVGAALVPVVTGREYEITFDAKWLAGSPQLRTELYYNKVAAVTILDTPSTPGTPGRRNSLYLTNAGPTYHAMKHFPVVPRVNETIEVSIQAGDPDGIGRMTLFYSVLSGNTVGPWQTVQMARTSTGGNLYRANIPAQTSASAIIHFYVEGADSLGAVSTYPGGGRASRALIKVDTARTNTRQIFRTIMLPSEATLMHHVTNMMSDDLLGCTVVHQEREVFYDANIRPHGSMFSRNDPSSVGLTVKFPADHLFRGSRESVVVRRRGMIETITKHILNAAGGIVGNYDDIVYLVSHNTGNLGNARLNLANYDDTFVDSQFENNNDGTVFKLEGIREYTTTHNNNPEGIKLSQPIGWIQTYDIANFGPDPEQYRWGIMIQSQRKRDDYSRIINLGRAFSMPATTAAQTNAFIAAVGEAIDVDRWARLFACQMMVGIADIYGIENPHNFAMYVRPDDGRVVGLQNDWEFAFRIGTGDSIYGSKNVYRALRLPPYRRIYQGHLLDLINSVCNAAYLTNWGRHFTAVTGEDNNLARTFVQARANSVRNQLMARIPFEITSNGGAAFSVDTPVVTLDGQGWIDVYKMRRAGDSNTLAVTWLDDRRWRATVPLRPGTNVIELEAFSFREASVGQDSITVVTRATDFPQRDNLRVTEFMYHPADPSPSEIAGGFPDADDFEFIELANVGASPVSLVGVKFTTGITFDFSTGSITNLQPSGRVLVVKNRNAFALRYGTNLPVAGEFTGNLANGGELVTLVDAHGGVIHEFTYSDAGDWPVAADGQGPSLEAVNLNGDYNSAANWRVSAAAGGTPGIQQNVPRAPELSVLLAPGPTGGGTLALHLKVVGQSGAAVRLESSTDLRAWSTFTNVTLDQSGNSTTIGALDKNSNFYRAVALP